MSSGPHEHAIADDAALVACPKNLIAAGISGAMGTCRLSPDRLAGRIGAADRGISNRIAAALDGIPVAEGCTWLNVAWGNNAAVGE